MATFVLVHGGWGGGWEWRPVADRLTAAGHVAYRPTLTGLGVSPSAFVDRIRALADTAGDGWLVPLPFDDLGVPPDVADWYGSHVGPHPLASLDQPLRLTGAVDLVPRSFIGCALAGSETTWFFRDFFDRARAEDWDRHDLPVGHDAHVIVPDRLATLLIRIASIEPAVAG